MYELKMLNSSRQESELIEEYIKRQLDRTRESTILEAGCGQRWSLKLDAAKYKYKISGIDLDRDSLEIRINKTKDLDEAIVGDLRYIDLGCRQFDIIYNSFVLEHIKDSGLVLKNFYNWLKPGGLLILKIPDRNTVFGFITRLTPFWFHIAYRRYFLKQMNAGKPGFAPYPTYYDNIICRNGIRDFCEKNQLIIEEEYGRNDYLKRKGQEMKFIRIFAIIVSRLSLRRLSWKHNSLMYVLRKDNYITNKVRLCKRSEPQSEPFVGQARSHHI